MADECDDDHQLNKLLAECKELREKSKQLQAIAATIAKKADAIQKVADRMKRQKLADDSAAQDSTACRLLLRGAISSPQETVPVCKELTMNEQKLILYQSCPAGSDARTDNMSEINKMLAAGWRVASMSATSSPCDYPERRIFALVLLERISETEDSAGR